MVTSVGSAISTGIKGSLVACSIGGNCPSACNNAFNDYAKRMQRPNDRP